MKILVVGATGATGRLLVTQLLDRGYEVTAIVRSAHKMLGLVEARPTLTVVEGNVLDLHHEELAVYLKGCDAVASCLGHNLTFKGVFGAPRHLVTDTVKRLCETITTLQQTTKIVLMNTTGVINPEDDPRRSLGERMVLWLLRYILPPHADNEQAAAYLQQHIRKDNAFIEWAVVRPDGLIDRQHSGDFQVVPSPVRSPIFDSGQTSRSNVAHLMADLMEGDALWNTWKHKMPVVYNQDSILQAS